MGEHRCDCGERRASYRMTLRVGQSRAITRLCCASCADRHRRAAGYTVERTEALMKPSNRVERGP